MKNEELKKICIERVMSGTKVATQRATDSFLNKLGILDALHEYARHGQFDLEHHHKMSDVIWCVVNDIMFAPRCKGVGCDNYTFRANEGGVKAFRECCSVKCSTSIRDWEAVAAKKDQAAISKKRQATMVKKYGVTTNSQRPEVRVIISKKTTNRYLSSEVQEKLNDKEWMTQKIREGWTKGDIAAHLGVDTTTVSGRLRLHGIKHRTARGCASAWQRQVYHFLCSLGIDTHVNAVRMDVKFILPDRKDLDIVLDDYMLAIECNGLISHCEPGKDRFYHLQKTKDAAAAGYRLIHIFEDEWKFDREQVQNFLKAQLGIFEKRVYARTCKFQEVDADVARKFFREFHLQKAPRSIEKAYGLFYSGELLGCVSFGKHHRKNNEFVLNRLAFVPDVQIIGGASKLVKNAVISSGYSKIVTWSDNRWTSGSIYAECGFTLDGELGPDYSYTKRPFEDRRIPKQSMKKKDHGIPDSVTERDYWAAQDCFRIWDCGKKRWVWNKS